MINVGMNVLFPKEEQKTHTIAMDIMQYPPEGIKYGWAYPDKTNDIGIDTHSNSQFDIIESLDIPLITPANWIATVSSIEFLLNFQINGEYYNRQKRINILEKLLKKDNTKKIIFFSKAGLASLKNYAKITDKTISDKAISVYNAVPDVNPGLLQRKKKERFRILFIGTAFYLKGGAALVEAFEILQQKYPFIELIIYSSLMRPRYLIGEQYQPLDHQDTLNRINNNSSIFHYNCFDASREKILNEVYPMADMLILPSMQEGLGFVIQEAMAYGLPIVSTNCTSAIPELIEDEKNGLIIDVKNKMFEKVYSTINSQDKRVITKESQDYLKNQIIEKVSRIIEDDRLRKEMKKNNLKKTRELFSFKRRNKIMKEIYEESI